MKLILALLVLGLALETQAHFFGDFVGGVKDMKNAYDDMIESNWVNSDKYFHARGNYDAAQRGLGGKIAATIISEAREALQFFSNSGSSDAAADQEANHWGRAGNDPNRYRPPGLPSKY
ncbi:hypothetical protein DNTS_032931 [Danionella cerebrum]|uniref:Serum amyloid A protein n=1 Tax=Danionella cerebrum TaxID=2873325 RepID=A0A553QRU3_9TELE|nr:hypothetical protein DNTS_032931 [Danionella translucida]